MIKRIVLICSFCLGFNSFCFSQDSIPAAKDLTEEKNLQFQEFFFKALSHKAIRNYQKAIDNLESCNGILPQNPIIYFELSKNYFLLGRTQEAKEYISKALLKKPDDLWMQLHLVEILKKERNFKEAITIQKKIVVKYPNRKTQLVYLYLQDRDYLSSIALMNEMENEKGLSKNLMNLKRSLEARKSNLLKKKEPETLQGFVDLFDKQKTLKTLLKILGKSETENKAQFQEYSKKGLEFFPAQPMVYLYRGKALNQYKLYKEALAILETGLDFVIDNNIVSKKLYTEIANTYKSLGNNTKYNEFMNKIKVIE